MDRRSFLKSAAYIPMGGIAASTLAGCVVVNGQPEIDPGLIALLPTAFVDQVTALVAAGCTQVDKYVGYIPTAASIASTVAALFGAAAVGPIIVTIAGAVQKVATDLCSAAPKPSTPAAAALAQRLGASSALNPVVIGRSPSGVVVHGYASWH